MADTEYQRIALGFSPRTVSGWWFWLLHWSPLALFMAGDFAMARARVKSWWLIRRL